jgi:hypothetical protein
LLTQPSFAQSFDPDWTEFCPPQFANSKLLKTTLWNSILYASRVNRRDNNYWVERKISFETKIKTCKELEDSEGRKNCFYEIRIIEQNKNNTYLAQKAIQLQKDMQFTQALNSINSSAQQGLQTQQLINAYNQPKQYYHNVNVRSY